MREYNFDGLVGPTHNYGGLSPGNVASITHGGEVSSPKQAALQGLEKMRFVASLGVAQAVLPPQMRPSLRTLRRLGFAGSDEEVITRVARENDHLLRLCASAATMWTANAATCAPSADTQDGRMHVTPANLQQMFHRAIEAETTWSVLKSIFADETRFVVHEPLPGGGQFADEGAANHTRLVADGGAGDGTPPAGEAAGRAKPDQGRTDRPAVHLFAWGRAVYADVAAPTRFPARQTKEASEALARLHRLEPKRCFFPQQTPAGIDAGAFHTDVLAVGNDAVLLLHEKAFVDPDALLGRLRDALGASFRALVASESELPVADAVKAYPFNSQLVTLPDGTMTIVAPLESKETPAAKRFLDRVVAEDNPVKSVHYLDVRQSMNNGGGPACLRQRIRLTDEERASVEANVFWTPELHHELTGWIGKHYRDRLVAKDLGDPKLARESMVALDELTRILRLGSVYEFQR